MLSPIPEKQRHEVARQKVRNAPEQAQKDMAALLACTAKVGVTRGEDVELFYLAALLLRAQDRVEEVLSSGEFKLHRCELIWAALAPHLKSAGYELSKRYMPGWTNHDQLPEGQSILEFSRARPETNGLGAFDSRAIHATRLAYSDQVVLKVVCTRPGTLGDEEVKILQYLNSPDLRNEPANAAVELLEVLDFPFIQSESELPSGFHVIVMPVLDSIGDFGARHTLDLMQQNFRAVAFLHSHGICHRDIGPRNLMVQDVEPRPPFTLRIIDFGYSFRIEGDSARIVQSTRAPWVGGQVQAEPESDGDDTTLYNPFKTEMYSLAFTWCMLLDERPKKVQELLDRMQDLNPDARPTAAAASKELDDILDSMPSWKLWKVFRQAESSLRRASLRVSVRLRMRLPRFWTRQRR
ncbi:hypothetical protein EXIGLDRAFT_694806 [Exidia glandulosa HHB12029]|uniref:Protein kinase domain-containing protein n=1 Tax=Exidia glandulosa HHB12029 TaxID=1314781 RepID=A0A165NJT9_EXIGL|nr:hypothetical protein EXIGLDRAFT_694806 [Exidia glandulosa HHB12029]